MMITSNIFKGIGNQVVQLLNHYDNCIDNYIVVCVEHTYSCMQNKILLDISDDIEINRELSHILFGSTFEYIVDDEHNIRYTIDSIEFKPDTCKTVIVIEMCD